MPSATHKQIVLLPWLGLREHDRLRWRGIAVAPWEAFAAELKDEALKAHIAQIVAMYRSSAALDWGGAQRGVGIVLLNAPDFQPLTVAQTRLVHELRVALFLAAMSEGTRSVFGDHSGHSAMTTENFELVFQNFEVGRDRLSLESGVLVRLTSMGYKLSRTRFARPAYVPSPAPFSIDDGLLTALETRLGRHPRLVRRILRSAAIFCESYYNTPALEMSARVMLQASAFEALLELPESDQRKEFKARISTLLPSPGRRVSFLSKRRHGKWARESGSDLVFWADRFYSLRNGLAHGDRVRATEYVFRSAQHHLLIAPQIFLACIRALLLATRPRKPVRRALALKVAWKGPKGKKGKKSKPGFVTDYDWAERFEGLVV